MNMNEPQTDFEGLFSSDEGLSTIIKLRNRGIAQREGMVARCFGELKCSRHPEAEFVRGIFIPGSYKFFTSDEDGFKFRVGWIYSCQQCLKEEVDPNKITVAYDCPFCGFVYGMIKEKKSRYYVPAGGDIVYKLEIEKIRHFCRVCGSQLGEKEYLADY